MKLRNQEIVVKSKRSALFYWNPGFENLGKKIKNNTQRLDSYCRVKDFPTKKFLKLGTTFTMQMLSRIN